jgi:4-amino-4-deoxy-L-arabinose transferase-like glycosyltransferase
VAEAALARVPEPQRHAPSGRLKTLLGRWWLAALAAVITCSCGVALAWVFVTPIFQAPDEPQHLDYALSIYAAGGLIRAADRPSLPNGPLQVAHAYPRYLIAGTDTARVIFHPNQRMAPDYGTRQYFSNLDNSAPREKLRQLPTDNPGLVGLYPFGYYSLLALWIALLGHLSSSITVLFFGSRILSVVLLALTLALTFAVACQLGCSRRFALLLTALCGLFPLTSFVGSAIQPDNLSLLLVTLTMFLALRARGKGQSFRTRLLIGAVLGLLMVTKQQFFLCVAVPVVGMLAFEQAAKPARHDWARWSLSLFVPMVPLLALHLWVVWGSSFPTYPNFPNTAALDRAFSAGPGSAASYVVEAFGRAVQAYYLGGVTQQSFWGLFGWTDTPMDFGSPWVNVATLLSELIGSAVIICLLLAWLQRRTRSLWQIGRRRTAKPAMRIALQDPFLLAALLFNLFMLAFYVATNGTFYPQGRNWIPFLLPIWMMAIRYAPSVLPRKYRRPVSLTVASLLMAYCVVGNIAGLSTLEHRFYAERTQSALGSALLIHFQHPAISRQHALVGPEPLDRIS